MLINTVILFLRDGLPIFIIAVLLLAVADKHQPDRRWFMPGVVIGVVASLVLTNSIGFVAQSFDSSGLERFFALVYLLIYLGVLVNIGMSIAGQSLNNALTIRMGSAVGVIALVLMLNGANFLVYITGYWSQSGAVKPLMLGVVLGLGICISVGILLYFSLRFGDRVINPYTSVLLMLLYAAGQLMQASKLLLQIDVFPGGERLWDSNILIKESSELGHFLTALFGYDATPTLSQVIMYFAMVVVPMGLLIRAKPEVSS